MPVHGPLYPAVWSWLNALAYPAARPVRRALARRLTALLVAQRLTPAALMRALPSASPVPARTRYAAVAEFWDHPALQAAALTPVLVPAALALVRPTDAPVLVLDSVRCGSWETFTIGLVWHSRVVPLAWAVQPYPLPKGVFTPTVCRLIQQVAAAWPPHTPRPHLLADRAFPSTRLFHTLQAAGWDWTIRVRASHWLVVEGERDRVGAQYQPGRDQTWTVLPATWGSGRGAVTARLVVGRGLPVIPWHQQGPASARAAARQHAQRLRDLRHKHPRQRADRAAETDRWVALFTTAPTALAAVRVYRQRWATEGSYRDAQSGWDGQHGWGLDAALARLPDPVRAAGVVGLWALGSLLQLWVGHGLCTASDPAIRTVVAEWTTTGRLSIWAHAHLAFTDPAGRLGPWLEATLAAGARRLATVPALVTLTAWRAAA